MKFMAGDGLKFSIFASL